MVLTIRDEPREYTHDAIGLVFRDGKQLVLLGRTSEEITREDCDLNAQRLADAFTGHGYVTEAAWAVLDYGFKVEKLNRICAYHMVRNEASGNVLARLGMKQEGHLRQMIKKWDVFEDVLVWSILRDEFHG